MFRRMIATAVLSFGLAASANAASIINGSFELGTDPGAGFTSQTAGSTAITGWNVGGFGVDYIGGYWQAADGVRSLDLSLLNAGSVSQDIATVVGTVYTVGFDLSGNPDGGTGDKVAVVSIAGSLPSIYSYTVTPANSRADMLWQRYSYTFTAFSSLSTLTFASNEYTPFGPALDNVTILDDGGIGATIPEPATWAMLLIGFGLIGVSARRRGTRIVAA